MVEKKYDLEDRLVEFAARCALFVKSSYQMILLGNIMEVSSCDLQGA